MVKLEATKKIGNVKAEAAGSWIFMENNCGDICESRSIESSIENNSSSSINSIESYSSSDLMEDASSNPPTSSSSSSSTLQNGPLFELSDLMHQLPLSCRRGGLSKYYEGKSQSFTCLTSVKSVEDLAKKISPYQIKKIMKPCKSYAGGLNVQKSDIRKKTSPRGSFLSRASNNNLSVQNL